MLLHLVRHGRPLVDPTLPPRKWRLDPSGVEAVQTLRNLLPRSALEAAWFSSDERKALETAQHLTDLEVRAMSELREAERGSYLHDQTAFDDAVKRGLQDQAIAAVPGWEPLERTRQRVKRAVDSITSHEPGDVVLVGHGTAWTLLIADLLDELPNLKALPRMSMPDLLTVDLSQRTVVSLWGGWRLK